MLLPSKRRTLATALVLGFLTFASSAFAEEASSSAKADPPAAAADEDVDTKHAVVLSGDLAFTRMDIGGFSDDTGLDADNTGANGFVYGFGAGYRQSHLRFGARFRAAGTTEYSLWSVMGEVGYGLGLKPVEPIFFVHAGYIWSTNIERSLLDSSLPQGNILEPQVDLQGAIVGVEAEAAYHVSRFIRLGPFLSLDAMFLSRGTVPLPQSLYPLTDEIRANPLYTGSGSGIGYALTFGIRGAADIGF